MTECHGSRNITAPNRAIDSENDFDRLKFVSAGEASSAKELRRSIFSEIGRNIEFFGKGTKPVYRGMSRGCELCGAGSWSCLFINGKCNCSCFYCPSEQQAIGIPTTNTLNFTRVQDYEDYVDRLGFKGVSLSGGEPLLTPDITLKFLKAVKRRFGDRVYLWMYTNGTLVDKDLLRRLKDAGLDEIRFDIGATEYSLKKAGLAVGVIDHVTVEIPAIPEELDLLKGRLREMSDLGISYLNLHQLRLTRHNLPRMAGRGYTCLHGEHSTVLESELAALNLLRHAVVNRIPLGVNYCSFVYKNRFQKAAARRRGALIVRKSYEDVTERGYVRTMSATGPIEAIESQVDLMRQSGCREDAWFVTKERDRIFLSAEALKSLTLEGLRLSASYSDSRIVPSISYRYPFTEIELNRNRRIYVERTGISQTVEIPDSCKIEFKNFVLKAEESPDPRKFLAPLFPYESIEEDLQDYA
jgi:pyruvate formate-lyase activating enzyme-like uncharacterized protein